VVRCLINLGAEIGAVISSDYAALPKCAVLGHCLKVQCNGERRSVTMEI
jgi:hypothetical protein